MMLDEVTEALIRGFSTWPAKQTGERESGMYYRIGTCGVCGGEVIGWRGAWYGDNHPGPDRCRNEECGAVVESDVIQMRSDSTMVDSTDTKLVREEL